ncbi:MAG: hypothetical protein GYA69_01455 [Candidatus Moranbacteria bacterium]|nr:hypothetical protein [Candidatus Moranbacteria bacterium]
MKKNSLKSLFNPASIAIVGASGKKGKIGNIIMENIMKLGYGGDVFLVNPSCKFIKFKRCHPSLGSIGKKVDLAIICVPAKFVIDVVKNGAKNAKNFVIISAGFSETGKEGAKREKELLAIAKKNNINILGPNCLGFIVPKIGLNASFAAGMPDAGNIAFVSQSGALAVGFMDKAKEEHLGFSSVISIGNKMQLGESELLEYLAEDRETKVIGMYLEGIKDGKNFSEIAKKVSAKKPIVILKAGKTAKAQQAISSHTGALAGSDEITSAVFEKIGIMRADNLDEFFDLLQLISFTDAPKSKNVAVVTNAGGAGVLATDSFKGKEIELAEFVKNEKENLRRNLPAEASVENPVDLLGDAEEIRYQKTLEILNNEKMGCILCLLTPQQQTPVEKISEILKCEKAKNKALIAAVFVGGERVEDSIADLKKNNVPCFSDPQSAVDAIDKYYKWNVAEKSAPKKLAEKNSLERKKQSNEIISKALADGRKALFFPEASEVMEKFGVKCVESYGIKPGDGVPEIKNYPVVLTVDSDKVLHKSDKQALILDIKNKEALELELKKLRKNFPDEHFVVQPMMERKTEIILGIKKDAIFGPVVVYGLGGIYTEVFKMVDFLVLPADFDEIKKNVMKGKLRFLFEGARGQASYNIEEFARILKGVADFARKNDKVREFDVNPLFIYNDGREALAADVKIIL